MTSFESKEFFFNIMEENSILYSRKYPLEKEEEIKRRALKRSLAILPSKLLSTPNLLVNAEVPIESFMGDFFNMSYNQMVLGLISGQSSTIDQYQVLKNSFKNKLHFNFSYYVFSDQSILLIILPDDESMNSLSFVVEYSEHVLKEKANDFATIKGIKHIVSAGANLILAPKKDFLKIMENQLSVVEQHPSKFYLINSNIELSKEELTDKIKNFIDKPYNSTKLAANNILKNIKM